MEWNISLLGSPEIRVAGESVPLPRTRKSLCLLALLVLEAAKGEGVLDRVMLAEQLWPDSPVEAAATNLRQSLAILRRSLGEAGDMIESPAKSTLRLNPNGLRCDVYTFDAAIARKDYESAVAAYRGTLLLGVYDDWLLPERDCRERACLDALLALSEKANACGDVEAARRWAEQAVFFNPLDEPAQRQLYTAYALEGNLAAARVAFRRFRLRLREEQQQNPDPETVACLAALTAEPPALGKPVPHRATTPRFLTTFVGRTSILAELHAIATQLETHLLTLLGPGGMGKTRLAIELARTLTTDESPEVTFVDLSPLPLDASVDAVYAAICAALGLRLSPALTAREAIATVQPEGWMILDNAETVRDSCLTVVEGLLALCHDLRLIVTSRQVLGISGEIRWTVPSLTNEEAAQLLRARANAVRPGSVLIDADVSALCARLDGMPLAIELAAGRLSVLTPSQLRDGLDRQRHRLLKATETNPSLTPARHITLHAALEGSWDLLTEPQRTTLSHLSIFAGGWTLDAVHHILFPDAEAWDALERIEELTHRSLVSVRGERGFLLDTIREFARMRLPDDEVAPLWERFARYYIKLAHLDKELALLPSERDNLYAALESAEAGTALQLYVALGEYFLRGGHFEEGRRFGAVLLDATPLDHPERAWALYEAGRLAQAQDDLDTAHALFTAGINTTEETDPIRIRLLGNLGLLLRGRGDLVGAERLYDDAVRLAERNEDEKALVTLRIRQAILADDLGHPDDAVRRFEELLESLTSASDAGTRGIILGFLGGLYRRRGNLPAAVDAFQRALPLHERYGYQSEIARVCLGFGRCLLALGAGVTEIEPLLRRARDTYHTLGDQSGIAQTDAELDRMAEAARVTVGSSML